MGYVLKRITMIVVAVTAIEVQKLPNAIPCFTRQRNIKLLTHYLRV